MTAVQSSVLTSRWTKLRPHEEQRRLVSSKARFRVVAAGRRSGKTENAKRFIVSEAMTNRKDGIDRNYIAAAPTRDQAKRIFWQDLKALSHPAFVVGRPSESELTITYSSGSRLMVVGLDKPQRVEGIAIDGAIIDEIAEVKRESWEQSIRPALSTVGRPGWCWLTGRPKGRGLFYDLYHEAITKPDWEAFTWTSATVLDASEIEQAKADLDPLTFAQEYEARWVTFEGLAYYQWNPQDHYRDLAYNPNRPLIFCFDFNVEPGVAAVLQEQDQKHAATGDEWLPTTCVIGEVHIPRNSNTPAVCRKLVADWGHHQGDVFIYGDPAGGARHTSSDSTDWDLVREVLKPAFGGRIRDRVARKAPYIRDRVNAVNSRLKSTSGRVSLLVDPRKAPNVVRDFEGVTLLAGGSGEVDKKGAEAQGLSHLSEAIGYYIHEKFPVGGTTLAIY